MWNNYDHTFLGNLGLLYVNGGFKVLYSIVLQEMMKTQYGLSPNELQVASAFIILPWDFKIFYGIMSDTVPLPYFRSSPKKGYLIIFSTVQFSCLLLAAMIDFPSASYLIYIFFTCSLCGAFMDVVIDGLTCI